MVTARRVLIALGLTLTAVTLLAATAAAQATPPTTTSTTRQPGLPTVTTSQMTGEVVQVDAMNNLVVKMSTGDLRVFAHIPDTRKAIIDGKEVGVRDLKPGTKLTATITTTTTPVTVRTTAVLKGTVWVAMGNTVILKLPNGETKQYTPPPGFKFIVNGQPATVFDLKPNMNVSAEKITEDPTTEIAVDSKVTGTAPRP